MDAHVRWLFSISWKSLTFIRRVVYKCTLCQVISQVLRVSFGLLNSSAQGYVGQYFSGTPQAKSASPWWRGTTIETPTDSSLCTTQLAGEDFRAHPILNYFFYTLKFMLLNLLAWCERLFSSGTLTYFWYNTFFLFLK